MRNRILDTGISVAYEPENGSPVIDIVFVHGLHGHPFKSWAYHLEVARAHESPPTTSPVAISKHERGSVIHRVTAYLRRKSSKAAQIDSTESTNNGAQVTHMFWPSDLLPEQCPDSRILMFGYDSKITKYAAGAVNQNSILSHSRDLLFALYRERVPNRPLVFVAHSLGGIIVKEMLAKSSTSVGPGYKSIVECTAKIVFLGTPHRGSQDVAALGEIARSIISSLGMETTSTILDALGLKTSDLDRAQEEFSKLWQEYDFEVKTFQEGLSLAKLGKKIVPDYSSSIGDHREHSETLQANHQQIFIEQHNSHDIATFVDHKFQLGIATQPQWELLRDQILEKSAGVFLWVALVVEDVMKSWDNGFGMPFLVQLVMDIPDALETLFSNLFSNLDPKKRELTVKFFQWAILATAPLRLHEWHHVMAFIRQPTLGSLNEWRQSVNFTETDEQLEKQIRNVSRGLVEVKRVVEDSLQDNEIEKLSVNAGAGSFNLENGNTRIVQVIHESVRDFFLKGNGFSVLDSNLQSNPIGIGHLSIMNTCLDYLNIAELDALVEARNHAAKHQIRRQLDRRLINDFAEGIYSTDSSSSYGSLEGYRYVMNRAKGLQQRLKHPMKREENTSFLAMLDSFDYAPNVDIVEWMKKGHPVSARSSSPHSFTHISLSHSSEMSQPKRLKDYPALLSYATVKLFTHAELADEVGIDPSPIVERLDDETTWARWIALKEDIPEGTDILTYAAHRGISSWVKAIPHEFTTEIPSLRSEMPRYHLSPDYFFVPKADPVTRGTKNRDEEESMASSMLDDSMIRPHDLPARGSYHRRRSVESFGSASSHG
ncbi:hypothetical protein MKX08_007721 [Trichoderma sp. CBMAI-0020]|nr:hypothetical protein MKX08_007721 [Trichoderma sp. CBMAI-0020]